MAKIKLEYIWLDGYTPMPGLRSKTKIIDGDVSSLKLADLPIWGFDGSSTQQAEGRSSDCVLKPVAVFPDASRNNGALVMCEVMMPDGVTPHPSNSRATILDDPDTWFGFEQEYFLWENGAPLGFPKDGYPGPQGEYYCGVGYKNVGDVARQIVEEHLELCLEAGINHEGINAEVAKVTHIAPADPDGTIIGSPVVAPGVIEYDCRALGLCAGITDARFVTTTEVYPDSPRATPAQCNDAQAAAARAAVDFALANAVA